MPFLFLGREDVEALLPMGECIEVVEAVLRALARGGAVQPLRSAYGSGASLLEEAPRLVIESSPAYCGGAGRIRWPDFESPS